MWVRRKERWEHLVLMITNLSHQKARKSRELLVVWVTAMQFDDYSSRARRLCLSEPFIHLSAYAAGGLSHCIDWHLSLRFKSHLSCERAAQTHIEVSLINPTGLKCIDIFANRQSRLHEKQLAEGGGVAHRQKSPQKSGLLSIFALS